MPIVEPGRPLRPGQIYESNGLLLATALGLAGACGLLLDGRRAPRWRRAMTGILATQLANTAVKTVAFRVVRG